MLLNELFQDTLNEYGGSHGFGGYGRGFFTRAFYLDIADQIASAPRATQPRLIEWFCDAFRRDNSAFKEDAFRKACVDGVFNHRTPRWEQRHFYYLAEVIKNIASQPMRLFIATFLADYFGRANGAFKRDRWFKFCDAADPDAVEEKPKPKRLGRGTPALQQAAQ